MVTILSPKNNVTCNERKMQNKKEIQIHIKEDNTNTKRKKNKVLIPFQIPSEEKNECFYNIGQKYSKLKMIPYSSIFCTYYEENKIMYEFFPNYADNVLCMFLVHVKK